MASARGVSCHASQHLFASLCARPWLLAAVLAAVTIAVYLPVHHHPFFTLDDNPYVVNNSHLRDGLSDTLAWAFTTYDLSNWHPVTWFSHAADVHMFGLDPAGHHDVNLLFHVINALLLFWVLLRATGYAGRSFMAAALFALHPVNVETVAWIAERKTLVSMMFFLLALGAYRWYTSKPGIGRYAAVAALYALGLMAKPQIITFPCVLLLWDYWPLRRIFSSPANHGMAARKFSWLLLEKLPLFALSAGSAVLTLRAQTAALRYYPLSVRLSNAIVSYVHYLQNAIWPSRLSTLYSHPALHPPQVLGASLVLLAITALVLYLRQQRHLAVGWFWFLGTLVPMIGIVQVGEQAMADRYAYVSFVGLFLMACWGFSEVAEQRRLSPAWLAAPSIAVLLVLAVLTHRQLSYWSDNVTLWSRMITITPTYEVEENLAGALLDSGQTAAALDRFRHVTALVPPPPALVDRELAGFAAVAYLYLGADVQRQGHPQEALADYEQVLRMVHDFAAQNAFAQVPPLLLRMKMVALGNMGDAYYATGDFSQAKASYEAALRLGPLSAHQWMGLGIADQRSGNLAAAVEAYSRSTRLQVSDVGFLLLAQVLEQSGRTKEADAARQQARSISPNLAAAEQTVANVLGR